MSKFIHLYTITNVQDHACWGPINAINRKKALSIKPKYTTLITPKDQY